MWLLCINSYVQADEYSFHSRKDASVLGRQGRFKLRTEEKEFKEKKVRICIHCTTNRIIVVVIIICSILALLFCKKV